MNKIEEIIERHCPQKINWGTNEEIPPFSRNDRPAFDGWWSCWWRRSRHQQLPFFLGDTVISSEARNLNQQGDTVILSEARNLYKTERIEKTKKNKQ